MISNPIKTRLDAPNYQWVCEHVQQYSSISALVNDCINRAATSLTWDEMARWTFLHDDVVRLRPLGPSETVGILAKLFSLGEPQLRRVLIAGRPLTKNNLALVVVVVMRDVTIIADNTEIDLGQHPRIEDVRTLLHALHRPALKGCVHIVMQPADAIESHAPKDVLDILYKLKSEPFTIDAFNAMFGAVTWWTSSPPSAVGCR